MRKLSSVLFGSGSLAVSEKLWVVWEIWDIIGIESGVILWE